MTRRVLGVGSASAPGARCTACVIDCILAAVSPAGAPAREPTIDALRFEPVTVRRQGQMLPPALRVRADEVIV